MATATHCIPWDEHCHFCNPPSIRNPDDDPSPVSGDTPKWGTPRRDDEDPPPFVVQGACGCLVWWRGGQALPEGRHCPGHTFSDLIEGERLLRLAQQKEPRV